MSLQASEKPRLNGPLHLNEVQRGLQVALGAPDQALAQQVQQDLDARHGARRHLQILHLREVPGLVAPLLAFALALLRLRGVQVSGFRVATLRRAADALRMCSPWLTKAPCTLR